VNRQSLATSKKNEERGQAFLEVGKMSKADVAQLTAQRAQDEYAVVEAESALRNYKRQLKQLLQITDEEEFDIVIPQTTDEMALQDIPSVSSVYASALENRPEIKSAQLSVSSGELAVKMAKAQWLPTLGLSASAVTSTTSMSSNAWTRQLKTNFDMGAGITLSIPLFDNRQARTAVNKAQLQQQSYLLDLDDKRTTLYSTVESYWLQAVTNQNKFKAAQVSVESQKTSYELLSEQFRLGLKNIVELMTGKNNLQAAQQNELQSKYLSILNIHMLTFYRDGKLQ
jgi:outer membrane protein